MNSQRTIRLAMAALLLPASSAFSSDNAWLGKIPFSEATSLPIQEVEEARYFEVPASRLLSAILSLEKNSSRHLTQGELQYYGRRDFECRSPDRLYLLRAAYGGGATGNYMLTRYGSSLLVDHSYLGDVVPQKKSALVVCLDFELKDVYGELYGGM